MAPRKKKVDTPPEPTPEPAPKKRGRKAAPEPEPEADDIDGFDELADDEPADDDAEPPAHKTLEELLASGPPAVRCSHARMAKLADLKPHPRNYNKHPQRQIELLAKVIAANGWRSPIVVSQLSGFVTKGHGRMTAAKFMGLEEVPVDDQEYGSEAEELADLVADNQIADLAEADATMLAELVESLQGSGVDVNVVGFDETELEHLLAQVAVEAGGDASYDSAFNGYDVFEDEDIDRAVVRREQKASARGGKFCPHCGKLLPT